ncbi:hypothetical protein DesLBE_1695 [Desulfitobacterium sp. LBE]|uniref:Uncharacterized protein n=3 Tax=Desulfitobacterium hafniense TaxID=49338 RepID=A0A0W1JD73_DESHA|nr:hypothetical protein Dhaf_1687 [Desulfitobacterium hafniense DCB-2]EHL08416.1 hypothetical protein HMPREF0322_00914 [Desulfitobacterium hafniense DP7]KTE89587.1 hypothetical protein AT727_12190 [Desulfitobacterium hafniense]TWH57420.1 hypothetical protein DesLBE_1695 [Desulfitobacterium sp. LBE]
MAGKRNGCKDALSNIVVKYADKQCSDADNRTDYSTACFGRTAFRNAMAKLPGYTYRLVITNLGIF